MCTVYFLSNVAIVIWLSLSHFDNSDDLSLPLPNPLNISFHPSIVLRVGLFVVPFCKYTSRTVKHQYIFAHA